MSQPLWRADRPLILASGSAARRALLEAAAIPHEIVPAAIDERVVEAPLRAARAEPGVIAAHLAQAKAMAVAAVHPDRLVLGADQVLALGDRLFTKPLDLADARRTLDALEGAQHSLHSAFALVRDKVVLATGMTEARLWMRRATPAFLDAYVAAEGAALCGSVGAYRLEGLGIHLFERIEGDHATILGLPLLPVLSSLRQLGYLLG